MGRKLGLAAGGLTAVLLAAAGTGIWAFHVRSWPEFREAVESLPRVFTSGYTGLFRSNEGPPTAAGSATFVVDILKDDHTVETRTLTLPGVDNPLNNPLEPGAMKIYAQRVMGNISVAVEPDTYVLRKDSDIYDHVRSYGAVINPAKLPRNYIGTLRDHAVAWKVEDGTKTHVQVRPDNYFQALSGCSQTPFSPPEENSLGEARLMTYKPDDDPVGHLPSVTAGEQSFYITQPDSRSCEQGGEGDDTEGCEGFLPFREPYQVYSSGRCQSMGAPLLDTCALVGELLICNLERVVAIRFRRQDAAKDDVPTYLIATTYLDDGTALPPRDQPEAYARALESLLRGRNRRAMDIQRRFSQP